MDKNPLYVFEDWLIDKVGVLGATILGVITGVVIALLVWKCISLMFGQEWL